MADASRKSPMRAPFVLFTVCALGGGIAGLCELPFRIHLTKGPLLGNGTDILLKAFLFAGFYACLYGLIGIVCGLLLSLFRPGFANGRLAVLAFYLLSVAIFVQYLSVPVNRQLPPLSHPKSLLVNGGLILGALALALAVNRLTGKKLSAITPKQGQKTEKILFAAALSLCVVGIFLAVVFQGKQAVVKPLASERIGRPNILLVTVDALRADHLSSYGYPHLRTENVDRLAAKGALFENVFSTTSWTLPACSTIATGLTPRAAHVQKMNDHLPEQAPTLAQAMAESGRATAAVTSNVFLSRAFGFDQGFDRFINVYDDDRRPGLSGIYLYDHLYRLVCSLDDASHVTKLATRQLDDLKQGSFFLWIHYMDPHKPYGGPWPLELPDYDKGYNGSIDFIYGWKEPVNELGKPLTQEDLRHVRALYDADILRFDSFFGMLLDQMGRRGLLDNTLIAVTADHGEEFLEQGDFGHGKNLHVQQTRIPLILAGPGVPSGVRVSSPASLLDLPPTLCRLAGVSPPETFQGRALFPLDETDAPSAAFSELQFKGRQEFSLRYSGPNAGRFCFIHDMRNGEEGLFDLGSDPEEQADIASFNREAADEAMDLLSARIRAENTEAANIHQGRPVSLDRDSLHVLQELGYLGN